MNWINKLHTIVDCPVSTDRRGEPLTPQLLSQLCTGLARLTGRAGIRRFAKQYRSSFHLLYFALIRKTVGSSRESVTHHGLCLVNCNDQAV